MNDSTLCNDECSAFLEHACLTYGSNDGPECVQSARDMLGGDPRLARQNVWAAACVGDVQALSGFLDSDSDLANRKGGPFNWEPLLYTSYSRLNIPDCSTLDAAKLLLDRGADPNAHYMWGGQYKFTALTGAFGEGERGPRCQPPHQDCEALARLLLEAGADPNDSQALYNTMFTPGHRCLELLLKFGLGQNAKCNWLVGCKPSGLRPNTQGTLQYQLMWAIRKCHTLRARLLLESGADATEPDESNSPWKSAVLAGHMEIIDDLLRHGAKAEPLSKVEEFVAACMAGNRELANQLIADQPSLPQDAMKTMPELLHNAASTNRTLAVRCLIEMGWDLNAKVNGNSALHQAGWSGHLDSVKLLVESGANPNMNDDAHNATPAEWAAFAGQREVILFLSSL